MIEVDRRTFVTGLAAVAGAVLPRVRPARASIARPGGALRTVRLPPAKTYGPFAEPVLGDSGRSALHVRNLLNSESMVLPPVWAMICNSRWQFQRHGILESTIRHCETGLLLGIDSEMGCDAWLMRASDDDALPVSAVDLATIGHAAFIVEHDCKQLRGDARDPVYLRYHHMDGDWPPSPRFAGFDDAPRCRASNGGGCAMTKLDRRAFVTGLAAVAGAGLAPVLPPRAALSIATLPAYLEALIQHGSLLVSARPAIPRYMEYANVIVDSADYLHGYLITHGVRAYLSYCFAWGCPFGACPFGSLKGFTDLMSVGAFGAMTDQQLRYADIIGKDMAALSAFHRMMLAQLAMAPHGVGAAFS